MIDFFIGKDLGFNIKKFLDNERIIMSQWEDKDTVINMTEEELINRFSLYMCHINDEMKEMYDAKHYIEADGYENYIKEIIDVAMYTASAINLFNIKYTSLTGHSILEDVELPTANYIVTTNEIEYIITKVCLNLSAIRELFPQRKWHKVHTKFTEEEYKDVLLKSYNYGIDIILRLIEYAIVEVPLEKYDIDVMDYDTKIVSAFINEKQRKIIRDAIKTGSNHSEEIQEELLRLNNELKE